MLGLTGPHRTGKTTLAREYAKRHDILFVQTSTSGVFEQLGCDPKAEYSIEKRLMIQEVVLSTMERQYRKAREKGQLFIADRTPIDAASYMLSEVHRTAIDSPEVSRLVNDYVARCLKSTMEHFSVVILVQPGIKVRDQAGKGVACPANIEHLNSVQLGLLADERNQVRRYAIPRGVTDLEMRIAALDKVFASAIEAEEALSKTRIHH